MKCCGSNCIYFYEVITINFAGGIDHIVYSIQCVFRLLNPSPTSGLIPNLGEKANRIG